MPDEIKKGVPQKTTKDVAIDSIFVALVENVITDEVVTEKETITTYQYTSKETKESSSGGIIPMFSYSVSSTQKELAQDSFTESLKLKGLWQ